MLDDMKVPVIALVLLSISTGVAAAPALVKVETGKLPFTISAPTTWEVNVFAWQSAASPIIGMAPGACVGGPEIEVLVQLDKTMKSVAQRLAKEFPHQEPQQLHGWSCIVEDSPTSARVFCARVLPGLTGVVDVDFVLGAADAEYRKQFGDVAEFTSQLAASFKWTGKLSGLRTWQHAASCN